MNELQREKVRKQREIEEIQQKIETYCKRIFSLLSPKLDVYAWFTQLATILNQTAPCDKCKGKGMHHKHINCYHDSMDGCVLGCHEDVICRKCKGSSRLPKN